MPEIKGLVSVTIPFYNREDFLSDAIESVLAQTYSHWELFLVDDGATDRSPEIARSYAARFPQRIHYLQHTGHANWGATRSRNLGAAAAHGEYLAFLDSDDVWLPNKLEHQVTLMEAVPEAGMCCGPSEYWYSWDGRVQAKVCDRVEPVAPPDQLHFPPSLFANTYPFGKYGAPCPSSFLLRRRAFDFVEGFVESFNTTTNYLYEDIAFLNKAYLRIPVCVSGLCTDRYRCRSDSPWYQAVGTSRDERGRQFYFRWLRQYLRTTGITDPSVWKAVRRTGWMYRFPLPAPATKLLRRAGNRLVR